MNRQCTGALACAHGSMACPRAKQWSHKNWMNGKEYRSRSHKSVSGYTRQRQRAAVLGCLQHAQRSLHAGSPTASGRAKAAARAGPSMGGGGSLPPLSRSSSANMPGGAFAARAQAAQRAVGMFTRGGSEVWPGCGGMRTKRARCLQLSVVEGGRRGELHELRWQVLRGGRQEERAEQQGLINCRGGHTL